MSWKDYFWLLVKYSGDLGRAGEDELYEARRANQDDPEAALEEALAVWHRRTGESDQSFLSSGTNSSTRKTF